MREQDLQAMLAERYTGDSYAYLAHVANATGGKFSRTADGLAMSLWPSRGLHISGFEIKVSRQDWLKELKSPEKAEEIARYCHYWWIVTPPGIVQDHELPPTWGLMEAHGKKLLVKAKGQFLKPKPLDYNFMAALLRATSKMIPRESVQSRLDESFNNGKSAAQGAIERAEQEVVRMNEAIAEFEKKSGIKIDTWNAGSLGEAVAFVRSGRVKDIRRDLEWFAERIGTMHKETLQAIKEYDDSNKPGKKKT